MLHRTSNHQDILNCHINVCSRITFNAPSDMTTGIDFTLDDCGLLFALESCDMLDRRSGDRAKLRYDSAVVVLNLSVLYVNELDV